MLKNVLVFALLASAASAQTVVPVVSGGGQNYSSLYRVSAWQSLELPMSAVAGLDRSTLSITAPGLSLKLLGTTVISGGQTLKLSLDVQQASGYRSGPTTFVLKDAAGHSVTFDLPVY